MLYFDSFFFEKDARFELKKQQYLMHLICSSILKTLVANLALKAFEKRIPNCEAFFTMV